MDISVVIPTYNRAGLIEKAIKSVLDQEGQGELFEIKEVIVVDDCSADETPNVVKELQQEDDRIVYHLHETNKGAGGARNTGAALAKSEWIAFQDSDDHWNADKLKVVASYMKDDPGEDLFVHFYEANTEDGIMTVSTGIKEDYYPELAERNFIGAPAIVVRKQAFLDVGGFDESMKALEDWDFALRFAHGHRICVIPVILLKADLTGSGVSSDISRYYDGRCYMIGKNRNQLLERGVFNNAVESLLNSAKRMGVLDSVGRILETYLKADFG